MKKTAFYFLTLILASGVFLSNQAISQPSVEESAASAEDRACPPTPPAKLTSDAWEEFVANRPTIVKGKILTLLSSREAFSAPFPAGGLPFQEMKKIEGSSFMCSYHSPSFGTVSCTIRRADP